MFTQAVKITTTTLFTLTLFTAAPAGATGRENTPFSQPFRYVGMSVADAAKASGGTPNAAGNIIIDSSTMCAWLESTGGIVSYVDLELKYTAPCSQVTAFDSKAVLGALGIDHAAYELARKQTHYHYLLRPQAAAESRREMSF